MKTRLLSLILTIFLASSLIAQDRDQSKEPAGFANVDEAADMAAQIVKAAGLKANFKIATAQVPNAVAVLHLGERYIFYNPRFISALTRATGTKWAAISVLAHEIGHHLYANSVNKGIKPMATELEADEFSGYVLQKMGATLPEAQAAMKTLASTYATRSHPGRNDRINSIAEGWQNAGGIITEEMKEPAAAETVVTRARTNTSASHSYQIAATIHFNSNPNAEYFVTKRMNVVKVENDQMELIARITRSNSSTYPYIIYDDSGYRLFVDQDGDILNSRGKVLGKLKAS